MEIGIDKVQKRSQFDSFEPSSDRMIVTIIVIINMATY